MKMDLVSYAAICFAAAQVAFAAMLVVLFV